MDELAINGGSPVRGQPFPQWPQWDSNERKALEEVLDSGRWWSTQGRQVHAFESAWSEFCGVEETVAVTNGTHALEVALMGAGIGSADEVIVTDYTFVASASAVAYVNAVPVLVDIDPHTYCIDPDAVEAAIGPRTAAVIAVHLAGHPADLDRLTEICERRGLALIEDCAHAHGSTWKGRHVGGFGTAGTFSFQQSKLMTSGEGGAVVADSPEVAASIRSFSDCGRRPGEWFYSHYVLGGNYRMTEWQAAVLLGQLERFDDQNRRRNENALWLNEALAAIPGVYPQVRDARTTSQGYFCYVVRIDEDEFGAPRDLVRDALIAEGLSLTMSYPSVSSLDVFRDPASLAPRHRELEGWPDFPALDLPHSRAAAATTLWFNHKMLLGDRSDVEDVLTAVQKVQTGAGSIAQRS